MEYRLIIDNPTTDGIEWKEEKRGNIIHITGVVGKLHVFDVVRFRNDNWIMTSRVSSMKMQTFEELDECKLFADLVIHKLIGELCLNMGIESPQIRIENK